MRKYFILAIALVVLLACNFLSPATPPAEQPTLTPVPPLADTPVATNTPANQSPQAASPQPPQAGTGTPTASAGAFVVPTITKLPQQWNGTYSYPTGQKQRVSLLIEKVDGPKFQGKMIWQSVGNSKGAILKMNGEFITDFGDTTEQSRWSNLEDYGYADKSGTWLKWTETQMISGSNYTVNGWYYAHIRKDGTMVAVYFFNKDQTTADSGSFVFVQAP